MQLVRHGGCVDGGVGPDDGDREVVVETWIGDLLEAHADWGERLACGESGGDGLEESTGYEFVPSSQGFRLEEIRCVVWGESLVDVEFCDLGWDCRVLGP